MNDPKDEPKEDEPEIGADSPYNDDLVKLSEGLSGGC